ncbi:MAG: YggT family protein [Candidatus Omnitrophica bacterium]|nr:YggT family protein [Candidatus Omnitrophota bacterium]
MFVIAYILEGLAVVVQIGLTIVYWLIVVRALISWVNPDPYNPIVQFLRQTTDPILEPLRRIIMPLTMMIHVDLSPLFAFFIIVFLQQSLVGIIYHVAGMFR